MAVHAHAASVMVLTLLVKCHRRARTLFCVKEPVKLGYTYAVQVCLLLYLQLLLLLLSLFLSYSVSRKINCSSNFLTLKSEPTSLKSELNSFHVSLPSPSASAPISFVNPQLQVSHYPLVFNSSSSSAD